MKIHNIIFYNQHLNNIEILTVKSFCTKAQTIDAINSYINQLVALLKYDVYKSTIIDELCATYNSFLREASLRGFLLRGFLELEGFIAYSESTIEGHILL